MSQILIKHYQLIENYYGSTKAIRSGVKYIQHVDEGLRILEHLQASELTKAAYCVHPIFQLPNSLRDLNKTKLHNFDKNVILLAMEYRNKANAYLCRPKTYDFTLKDLPYLVLDEVKDMLIADKVQNYNDFLQYHKNTHEHSIELDKYFNLWFQHLEIKFTDLQQYLQG